MAMRVTKEAVRFFCTIQYVERIIFLRICRTPLGVQRTAGWSLREVQIKRIDFEHTIML